MSSKGEFYTNVYMSSKGDVENVDLKEIHFSQSTRSLTEAKIHHLLSETMNSSSKKARPPTYRYSTKPCVILSI